MYITMLHDCNAGILNYVTDSKLTSPVADSGFARQEGANPKGGGQRINRSIFPEKNAWRNVGGEGTKPQEHSPNHPGLSFNPYKLILDEPATIFITVKWANIRLTFLQSLQNEIM